VIQLTLNLIILLLGLPLKGFFWIIQSLFPLMVVGLIVCFALTSLKQFLPEAFLENNVIRRVLQSCELLLARIQGTFGN
jgi:hypothetical protein